MVKPLSIWGEKPLKLALNALIRPMLGERDKLLITLTGEWKLIVGEDIAAYTHPQALNITKTDTILTLGVMPGMNTLIAHQEPELLEKINHFIGQGRITRLKISTRN